MKLPLPRRFALLVVAFSFVAAAPAAKECGSKRRRPAEGHLWRQRYKWQK
jgi:hypothetical protein